MQNTERQIKTIKIDDNLNTLHYFRGLNLLPTNDLDSYDILLLDITAVHALDTGGIGSLLAFYEQMVRKGKEVALVSSSQACTKVLTALGLDNIFWFYTSMEAARKELSAIATGGMLDIDTPTPGMISPLKYIIAELKVLNESVG